MRPGLTVIIFLTVLGLVGLLATAMYRTFVLHKLTGLSVFNDQDLVLLVFFVLLSAIGLPVLFFAIRMDTELHPDCLRVTFWPFKEVTIALENIASMQIVQYDVQQRFNGFGIRENDDEYALVLLARKGPFLDLLLYDGKRFLISSHNAELLMDKITIARQTLH